MRLNPFLMFLFLIVACLVPMVAQANAPDAPDISFASFQDESPGDAQLASMEIEFLIVTMDAPADCAVVALEVATTIPEECRAAMAPTRAAFAWEIVSHRTQTATSPPSVYSV